VSAEIRHWLRPSLHRRLFGVPAALIFLFALVSQFTIAQLAPKPKGWSKIGSDYGTVALGWTNGGWESFDWTRTEFDRFERAVFVDVREQYCLWPSSAWVSAMRLNPLWETWTTSMASSSREVHPRRDVPIAIQEFDGLRPLVADVLDRRHPEQPWGRRVRAGFERTLCRPNLWSNLARVSSFVILPVLGLAALRLVFTTAHERRALLLEQGRCPNCSYPALGLTTPRCPECGCEPPRGRVDA
jgi:hypothetical protein